MQEFNPAILEIANASPTDFAQAMAEARQHDLKKAKPGKTAGDEFKLALRDEVMKAFDVITADHPAALLSDCDLPQLFACIDLIGDELRARYNRGSR